MKIDKTSWHYRLLICTDKYPAENLCPYFRQVMLALIGVILGTIFMSVVAFVALVVILAYPLFVTGIAFEMDPGLALVSGLVLTFLLYSTIDYLFRIPLRNLNNKLFKPYVDEYKEPGLIRSRIKAFHDKVCPEIDFK